MQYYRQRFRSHYIFTHEHNFLSACYMELPLNETLYKSWPNEINEIFDQETNKQTKRCCYEGVSSAGDCTLDLSVPSHLIPGLVHVIESISGSLSNTNTMVQTAACYMVLPPSECILKQLSHAPPADAHQPGVYALEVVHLRVIGLWLEPVTVKDLDLALVPARTNGFGAIAKPDLHVCQVVFLLLSCKKRSVCSSLRWQPGLVLCTSYSQGSYLIRPTQTQHVHSFIHVWFSSTN